MFRGHELIASLKSLPEGHEYREMFDRFEHSMCFDLGPFDGVKQLAELFQSIAHTFDTIRLPARHCMFQISNGGEIVIVTARELEIEDTEGNEVPSIGFNVHKPLDRSRHAWGVADIHGAMRQDKSDLQFLNLDGTNELTEEAKDPTTEVGFAASLMLFSISAVQILSCSNVYTRKHNAPPKLQRRNRKRGRPPFMEWHTLRLGRERSEPNEPGGGHHASPRLHFRRGHIRCLADGRKIWVRSTMVGDVSRGIVRKDYELVG